ncbi:unnamed protein product [Arctogadus glacialis]
MRLHRKQAHPVVPPQKLTFPVCPPQLRLLPEHQESLPPLLMHRRAVHMNNGPLRCPGCRWSIRKSCRQGPLQCQLEAVGAVRTLIGQNSSEAVLPQTPLFSPGHASQRHAPQTSLSRSIERELDYYFYVRDYQDKASYYDYSTDNKDVFRAEG